jgi:hypothetical protein
MYILNSSKTHRSDAGFGAVGIIIIVIAIALIGVVGWKGYDAWKSSRNTPAKTMSNTTTPKKTTTVTTPTPATNPYAGWASATLKYEKLTFKYPATWTVANSSTAGGTSNIPQVPGSDEAKLVSPTGLTLVINTGDTGTNGGPYFDTVLSTTPIATLGGNYYLGFGTNEDSGSVTTTVSGSIGTTADANATWPQSKNITDISPNTPLFNIISMFYLDATGNAVSKPVSAFQSDPSYNDALLIIKSLTY